MVFNLFIAILLEAFSVDNLNQNGMLNFDFRLVI